MSLSGVHCMCFMAWCDERNVKLGFRKSSVIFSYSCILSRYWELFHDCTIYDHSLLPERLLKFIFLCKDECLKVLFCYIVDATASMTVLFSADQSK